MTITYVDVEMEIAPPTNRFQATDLATWMSGNTSGDTISSPLNPALY